DASNFDLGFARNRLRHAVIPNLASQFNPILVKTLSRTVEIVEEEDAWMCAVVEEWLNDNGTTEHDKFVVGVEELQRAPVALARRAVRGALRRAGSELHDISFDQIESIRALLDDGKSGKLVEVPGGLEVAREFDRLAFRRRLVTPSDYEYE